MLRCGKGEYNRSNSRANTCEKSRFSWKGCSKTYNCEFFQKSKVAVPELAGSVEENWKSLLDKNYKFINEKKLKHFIESIMALLDQFCIVNLYGQWSLYGQIWKIFHFNSG
jgi:hypothetical protein